MSPSGCTAQVSHDSWNGPGTDLKKDRVAMPVDSDTLLGRHKELPIWHQGQLYRLQITRQGKLILTK